MAAGIDFSDCVEKSDLVSRAALHLPWPRSSEKTASPFVGLFCRNGKHRPGVAEPWDSAPEQARHAGCLFERDRSVDMILQRPCQAHAIA